MPVFKKDFVDLVLQLAEEANDARQNLEVDRYKMVKRDGMIKQLSLKIQFLTDNTKTMTRQEAQ